ncbi:hypothetical protein Btru_009950 [Bulinus truncatus]|nr:hypothetical protein Btru_009950 [Bulinus truncatus]
MVYITLNMENPQTDVPDETETTEGGDVISKDEDAEDVKAGGATGKPDDNDGNEPNNEPSVDADLERENNAEEKPDDAEEQPAEPGEQPDVTEEQPDLTEIQPEELEEQPEEFKEEPAEEDGEDVGVGEDLFGEEETTKDEEAENTEENPTKSPAPADPDEGEVETNEVEVNRTEEAVQMSDEDRAKCQRLFEKKAVNGRLNLTGLKAVFRLMGQILSSSDADQIFDEADKDNDNSIDFDEFCRLYSKFGQEEEARQSVLLTSVDRLFKSNQNGEVELKEVEQVLLQLQQPGPNGRLLKEKSDLCPEDIRSLVRKMDKDGNGRISKKEFVSKLCQHVGV